MGSGPGEGPQRPQFALGVAALECWDEGCVGAAVGPLGSNWDGRCDEGAVGSQEAWMNLGKGQLRGRSEGRSGAVVQAGLWDCALLRGLSVDRC